MASFDKSIPLILEHEGGYVNNPKDPGGETNFGISKRYHPTEDIKNMSVERAKQIYKAEYWKGIGGDLIESQAVADSVFDFAVNKGPSYAMETAKKAAAALGFSDWRKVPASAENDFSRVYGALREAYYRARVKADPSQEIFLKSWLRRTKSFVKKDSAFMVLAVVSALSFMAWKKFKKGN